MEWLELYPFLVQISMVPKMFKPLKLDYQGTPLSVKWQLSLRKHAYSNILNILPPKNENFQIKISDIFHISAPNIDCGYSFALYPQSMFLSRIKKNNVYSCKPQFYYIKVGFEGGGGVKII